MGTEDEWDVIVVGAGLGGLTAAVRLLREGLRVLVLEAGPHPGGTAYSYRRKGYHFPMGPLGFAHPELVEGVLFQLGTRETPSFQRVHYRLHAFGISAPLSLPYQEMVTELSALFPGEKEGVTRFFLDMSSLSGQLRARIGSISPMARILAPGRPPQGKKAAHVQGKPAAPHGDPGAEGPPEPPDPRASAASYLVNITRDWRLRRILGSAGTREPYAGLGFLASMWSLLCESGIHYPRGGMRGLCDLLAAPLGWSALPARGQDNGWGHAGGMRGLPQPGAPGEAACPETPPRPGCAIVDGERAGLPRGVLLLRCPAHRIVVDKGRVKGVIAGGGTFYRASAVVCNTDFKHAFLRLLEPGDVPAEIVRAIAAARQTSSNLQVCLGIDTDRVDLSAFREGHRVIYRRWSGGHPRDGGPDWSRDEIDPRDLAGEETEVALLSADDPSLAPEGRAVLVIRTPAEHSHFRAYRPSPGRRTATYASYKSRLGLALVEEVSNLLPGLQGSVEVMDVATPLTFEERGGRSEGAVAGWSWDFRDNPSGEARELVRTPIAGLFMAGHQAFSMLAMGGVPSALFSGLRAAEYVLAGADPADGMDIPGMP
ncbi:MAG: NAD(P)/FAD-dependent oxidoreductase [Actinobacteria bacterium]|nr:NAD(P)/FAD-dependent oxidoreductase [Actinomycetota bacterium]